MKRNVPAAVLQKLDVAVFQRNARGRLRRVGLAPQWLRALWPAAAKPRGLLRPEMSPFLANFLVDAEACWKTGGAARAFSGPWIEQDARGNEHGLQAVAFAAGGRALMAVGEPKPFYEERAALVQRAHELALAYEKLQRAKQALDEEKRLLGHYVQERTAALSRSNAALQQEIVARQRFEERLRGEHELNKAILAARSPREIAETALRRLKHLLSFCRASVVVLDSDQERATVLASVQEGKAIAGGGWSLSHAQIQGSHVLMPRQVHQAKNQTYWFADPSDQPAERDRVWPLLVEVPLTVDDTLVGILSLATDAPATFTNEHRNIAREVAAQLAVALRQARLFAEVAASRERMRALSARLLEVQETERRFLAHELHDEIGQLLTGLKLTLQRCSRGSLDSQDSPLKESIGMVDELMQRVRQLSLDLRPQMLDDLGLMPALDWLFQRYSKQAGLRVHFEHMPVTRRLPTQLETAVFRIVQEALTNVVRHARVAEVTVRLWHDRRGRIQGVQVHDKGVGFDVQQALSARASGGLAGMKERATLLGGQFTLESAHGAGTRLTVELPLPAAAADKTA